MEFLKQLVGTKVTVDSMKEFSLENTNAKLSSTYKSDIRAVWKLQRDHKRPDQNDICLSLSTLVTVPKFTRLSDLPTKCAFILYKGSVCSIPKNTLSHDELACKDAATLPSKDQVSTNMGHFVEREILTSKFVSYTLEESEIAFTRQDEFRCELHSVTDEIEHRKGTFASKNTLLKSIREVVPNLQFSNLLRYMQMEEYEDKEYVIRKGDVGEKLYFLAEGKVKCFDTEGGHSMDLGVNSYFGERALMDGSKLRTMNIQAASKTLLFSISAATVEDILAQDFEKVLFRNILQQNLCSEFPKHFSNFTLLDRLIDQMTIENLNEKDFEKVQASHEKIIIIIQAQGFKQGQLVGATHLHTRLASFKDSAENQDCVEDELRKSVKGAQGLQDLFMSTDSKVAAKVFLLDVSAAVEIYSNFTKNKYFDSRLLAILENTQIFKTFKQNQLKSLAFDSELRKFKANEVIFQEGDLSDCMYLIVKGEVHFTKKSGTPLRIMSQSNIFGERGLQDKTTRTATAFARQPDTILMRIPQTLLQSEIPDNFYSWVKERDALYDVKFSIDDFHFVNYISKGSYGSVFKVFSRSTRKFQAVKVIAKCQLKDDSDISSLKSEIDITREVDHPFIMKMIDILSDKKFIQVINELVSGGSFHSLMGNLEPRARADNFFLYAIQLLETVWQLQGRGIVHRDLKPENILVNERGQLKLIDFGFAKKLNGERAHTVLGTYFYMAPEMIIQEGYGLSVDLFSLGVIMYEYLFGTMPFGHNKKDYKKVFEQIVKYDYKGNKEWASCKHTGHMELLDRLLIKNPRKRMQQTRRAEVLSDFQEQMAHLDLVSIYTQENNSKIPSPGSSVTESAEEFEDFLKNNIKMGQGSANGLDHCTSQIKTFALTTEIEQKLEKELHL